MANILTDILKANNKKSVIASTAADKMSGYTGSETQTKPPVQTPVYAGTGLSKLLGAANTQNQGSYGDPNAVAAAQQKIADTLANQQKQTTTTRKSSAPAPTKVNPYQAQMDAAQARLSAATPTYTDTYADRIAQLEAAAPQDYASRYQTQIDNTLNAIQNRKAFQYNMSEDPLYRQYAAMYQKQGQQAMKDTMGQAAALTGGYGSSYASTAGNQAYQQYLGQMNDRAAELAALARQQYDQEGSNMRANLSALQAAESQDRKNYESDRADYYNRLNALRQGQSTEYQQYLNALDEYWRQKNDAWNQYKYWNDKWAAMQ